MIDRPNRFSPAKWPIAFAAVFIGLTMSACADQLLSPASSFDASQRIDAAAAMAPGIIGKTKDEVVVQLGEPGQREAQTETRTETYWYWTDRRSGSQRIRFLDGRVVAIETTY